MTQPDRQRAFWQLPTGVSPGLWDYLHDEGIARGYEASLGDSPLVTVDKRFLEQVLQPPGRVLDMGCGTGRLTVPLAGRGFAVTGVDLSEEMLKVAAENLRRSAASADLLKANLVELDCLRDGSFDAAICMFSTLGMIAGAENRQRVLGNAHRLLRPGGLLVLHVHNRWHSFWNPVARWWLFKDLARSILPWHTPGDQIMPYHQGISNLYLHVFTRRETKRVLRAAGFRDIQITPIALRLDGKLRCPWWFGWLRAHGYFALARRD